MGITKFSKEYHEKMFPGYVSAFLETDPEFIERFDNFAFDEVVNQDDLDDRTRFMAILATLLGCQGIDEYRAMVPAAMNFGVTPVEIKEITYQGNSLVIYYDTNSWNFTRIGKIEGVTGEELLEAFGSGSVTVTFSLE